MMMMVMAAEFVLDQKKTRPRRISNSCYYPMTIIISSSLSVLHQICNDDNDEDHDVKPVVIMPHDNHNEIDQAEDLVQNPEYKRYKLRSRTANLPKKTVRANVKKGSHQCHLCGKVYKGRKRLVLHVRSVHETKKAGDPLLIRLPRQAGEEGSLCPTCGKTFKTDRSLKRHMSTTHLFNPSTSKKKVCPICHTRFNSRELFQAHTHPDPSDPEKILYTCHACNMQYKVKISFLTHRHRVHGQGERSQCHSCGKVFRSKFGIQHHSRFCSLPPEERRKCPVPSCAKVFSSHAEAIDHERVVHKELSSNKCYFCNQVFTLSTYLQRHLRHHTLERPFACSLCAKDFTRADGLKDHMTLCGADEEGKEEVRRIQKEYQRSYRATLLCPLCGKKFCQKAQLIRHQERCAGSCVMLFNSKN